MLNRMPVATVLECCWLDTPSPLDLLDGIEKTRLQGRVVYAPGIAEFVPATEMNTPTYCPHEFVTKPMIGTPISETKHRKHSTGPRVWYLSLNQAALYIRIPVAAYGGAPKHGLIAILNFNFVLRMIGNVKAKP